MCSSDLRKSNFDTDPETGCCIEKLEAEVRMEVCRKFAELCIEYDVRHYSQWFRGKLNDVSDALSRDDDRTDEELTNVLYSCVPEQMPQHFEIAPVPNEILLWLTALLQKLPVKEQLQERHSRTKLGRGDDGRSTADQLESTATSTSTALTDQTEPD